MCFLWFIDLLYDAVVFENNALLIQVYCSYGILSPQSLLLQQFGFLLLLLNLFYIPKLLKGLLLYLFIIFKANWQIFLLKFVYNSLLLIKFFLSKGVVSVKIPFFLFILRSIIQFWCFFYLSRHEIVMFNRIRIVNFV